MTPHQGWGSRRWKGVSPAPVGSTPGAQRSPFAPGLELGPGTPQIWTTVGGEDSLLQLHRHHPEPLGLPAVSSEEVPGAQWAGVSTRCSLPHGTALPRAVLTSPRGPMSFQQELP